WRRDATLAGQPYRDFDRGAAATRASDHASQASHDVADDVRRCVEIANRRGLEVLVLDQTRPDIGLPVVKVIVPGLRHFWARFGPGRLYDVPVRLGGLAEPTPYEQLNPIPLFA